MGPFYVPVLSAGHVLALLSRDFALRPPRSRYRRARASSQPLAPRPRPLSSPGTTLPVRS